MSAINTSEAAGDAQLLQLCLGPKWIELGLQKIDAGKNPIEDELTLVLASECVPIINGTIAIADGNWTVY
ncbi:MAG: hypothetical protein JST50_21215 [Bacteroidetes bacterium]|jgi:hypothetical protein|nr:hypothetical protein [Bacteroidota bacterium]